MADNPSSLENDIHHLKLLTNADEIVEEALKICDKITGLSDDYDLANSTNQHLMEKAIKELYRNLDNFGITGRLGLSVRLDEIDAGFLPKSLDSFTGSNTNPLTTLTGIEHGYSMKKINPNYTGYALRGFMGTGVGENQLTYDIRFDEDGNISRNSLVDVVSFEDDTFDADDFTSPITLGSVMDTNKSAVDAGTLPGTPRGKVLRWYDQFGNNNLVADGRSTSNVGILSGKLGPTFYTGTILFDHIRIANGELQPRNPGLTYQTLMFDNNSVTLKCASATVATLAQGGGSEIQGLLGGWDAVVNMPYIFLSPTRSAYQISVDGAAGDKNAVFQNGIKLMGFQAGGSEDEEHFTTTIDRDVYYTFDFFYKPGDPNRNNFDGIGFNGTSNQSYVGNFKIKEMLISDELEISGQRNKIDKAAKGRYGHY
jgi:hypothetical protein